MSRRQVSVFPRAVGDNIAKIEGWHRASPVRAAALAQIAQGFVRKRVQATPGSVFLKLVIPSSGVEFREPRSECGEFRSGKLEYGLLDLLHGPHKPRLSSRTRSHNRTPTLRREANVFHRFADDPTQILDHGFLQYNAYFEPISAK
jgi:hypothetical protein